MLKVRRSPVNDNCLCQFRHDRRQDQDSWMKTCLRGITTMSPLYFIFLYLPQMQHQDKSGRQYIETTDFYLRHCILTSISAEEYLNALPYNFSNWESTLCPSKNISNQFLKIIHLSTLSQVSWTASIQHPLSLTLLCSSEELSLTITKSDKSINIAKLVTTIVVTSDKDFDLT